MPRRLPLLLRQFLPLLVFCAAVAASAAAGPFTREQALRDLDNPAAAARRAAVTRLGEIGRAEDDKPLLARLKDDDAEVRAGAERALWAVWGRSGDRQVDALLVQGTAAMNSGRFEQALAAFNQVIRRKPGFAEGWNKRATLYYMAGEVRRSLEDCREVLKRNPNHFGALSGFGLLYLQLEEPERALEYFERAYAINPGMDGVAANIEGLRRMLAKRHLQTAAWGAALL
jgi:tetratricopeptide (TPR) repeat protein